MQATSNIMHTDSVPTMDVWACNFRSSIEFIKQIKQEGYCKIISFDTEFPGLSFKPQKHNAKSIEEYQTVIDNVNNQKMI